MKLISSYNIGKYKMLVQQAFGILNLPIAMLTNAAVMIGFFGVDIAALVFCVIMFVLVAMMLMLDRFMLAQEINYSWTKAGQWQEFRREWKAFMKERGNMKCIS